MALADWDVVDQKIDFEGSEETLKFTATITKSGKPVSSVSNDGRGGVNVYQGDNTALEELKADVSRAVRSASDHEALQYEVTDFWVQWKLTHEPAGVSFEQYIADIDAQLRAYDEPVEEGLIDAILHQRMIEDENSVYLVATKSGKVVSKHETREEAEEFISENGGKLDQGLSVWQKTKGSKSLPRVGQSLDPQEVAFGGFSSPGKMPCKALSYKAGESFTCPRGYKLLKYPGSVCYFCYGAGGLYIMPTVQLAQNRRLTSLLYAKRFPSRQEHWISSLVAKLGKRMPYFRWHETGDIQDETHWNMMLEVIRRTPHINHWIPTKEQDLIYAFLDEFGPEMLPMNVNVRVSAAMIGRRIKVRAPLTTSSVSDVESGLIPAEPGHNCPPTWNEAYYKKYKGTCGKCRACWQRSVANVNYKLHLSSQQMKKYRGAEYRDWVKSQGGVDVPPEKKIQRV